MVPQANLSSDLQTKIPDRITGLTAFIAMVGSAHRTAIKHGTGSTGIAVKDGMERSAGRVVAE